MWCSIWGPRTILSTFALNSRRGVGGDSLPPFDLWGGVNHRSVGREAAAANDALKEEMTAFSSFRLL